MTIDVKRATSEVPLPHLAFWFSNGVIVRSLQELADAVEHIDPAVFHYHVNKEKNDLSEWISGVFADPDFAEKLRHETSRKEFARKLKVHLRQLEKAAKSAS